MHPRSDFSVKYASLKLIGESHLPNIAVRLLATGIMTKIAASIKNNAKSIGNENSRKEFELPPLFETSSESVSIFNES